MPEERNGPYRRKEGFMEPYIHHVQYYETDRMGITHHSNYIRWMEEARIDYLDRVGLGYKAIEDRGVIVPVLEVSARYRETTTFDDRIAIRVWITEFKGLKFSLAYEMTDVSTGRLVFTGASRHCFLDSNKNPLRLKKEMPDIYAKFEELAAADAEKNPQNNG